MHSTRKIYAIVCLLAIFLIGSLMTWRLSINTKPPIRIGLLHSLTGTMTLNESQLVDAVRLAVEEINAKGGLLGRPLEMVVADSQSEPNIAASEAERLISQEKVDVLFGCWTSSCRKVVKPVVERHNHLLFYPVQYEGMEQSPNIIYTGAAPNQQIVPGTRWAMSQFGKRVFLVGSDYVFPRTANIIITDLVNANDGEIVAEHYVPLASDAFTSIVEDIRMTNPDIVLNTLNGDSNAAFFTALVKAGLVNIPIMSFSVAEAGMQRWGGNQLKQHYAVWSYFQSLPGEENQRFISAYQARFGADKITNDPIEASYVGVHFWAQAVEDVSSSDPELVNPALLLQSIASPSGIMAVDATNRHVWRYMRIGKVQADSQFEQVFSTDRPVRPFPWPGYRSHRQWQAMIVAGH